jgi:hypothetical protein
MAKIIVGKSAYTDADEAVKAIAQMFGISEHAAILHTMYELEFKNEESGDDFIAMIEEKEKVSDVSDYDYIKMFLGHEGAVDIEFDEGDCLEQITSMNDLLC